MLCLVLVLGCLGANLKERECMYTDAPGCWIPFRNARPVDRESRLVNLAPPPRELNTYLWNMQRLLSAFASLFGSFLQRGERALVVRARQSSGRVVDVIHEARASMAICLFDF